jgi:hypothetical protein
MPRFTAALHRLAPLYDGHDAGHFTLPESALSSRSAFLAVTTAEAKAAGVLAPLDPGVLEDEAISAIFDAAEAGSPVFDPGKPAEWTARYIAARTEREQRDAEVRALRRAAEIASDRLTSEITDDADTVLVEHCDRCWPTRSTSSSGFGDGPLVCRGISPSAS